MGSLNKVQIIGNLGADPEMKYLPSGSAVCNFSVATTDKWKDKTSGEQQERTEWHRVSFFGRPAEVITEYMRKGSAIYVEGSIQTRSYEKDGQKHYVTEIKGRDFQFLGGGQQDGGTNSNSRSQPAPAASESRSESTPRPESESKQDDFDDDIPF